MNNGVAVIDYGMGNLYSVFRACEHVGLDARLVSAPEELLAAPAAILPGVGAFADAMAALRQSGMDEALREFVVEGRPLFGICLGMQLLMTESHEFGVHAGLDLVPGVVRRLEGRREEGPPLKVPQVGWNQLREPEPGRWKDTPLEVFPDGESVYFVHSYRVVPEDPEVVLSTTRYGDEEFCSTLGAGNVFGCQYHPELSGRKGLELYRSFATRFITPAIEGLHDR